MDNEFDISYYKEISIELIDKLKDMFDNNLDIVCKNIREDLSDDKVKAALESRRIAAEGCLWAAEQIDKLQEENKYKGKLFSIRKYPELVKSLRGMAQNNLQIVGREIENLTDDKLKHGLLSREMAAKDSVWAAKQVDAITQKLQQKGNKNTTEVTALNWTKINSVK